MTWQTIVGKRFSAQAFETYVQSLAFGAWRPSGVVVHNTAQPSLAQRPHGFTDAHMQNLVTFYRDTQKWNAGPHAFVDQNGIWVFTPLTVPGVHSPSWNASTWGVETLGNYEAEPFTDPIKENLLGCLTVMHRALGIDPSSLRFHKEDPLTKHKGCPGKHLDKPDLIALLTARLSPPPTQPDPALLS